MGVETAQEKWFVWDKAAEKPGFKSRAHQIANGFYAYKDRVRQWAGITWLPGGRGDTLLDVACGNGNYCRFFQERGLIYTGCDLSENMLEQAREENPDAEFVRGDASDLPFEDNQFDMVFCSDLLIHVPQEYEERIVNELLRVADKKVALHQRVVNDPPRVDFSFANGTIHRFEVLDEELKRMLAIDESVEMHIRNSREVANRPGADIFFIFNLEQCEKQDGEQYDDSDLFTELKW